MSKYYTCMYTKFNKYQQGETEWIDEFITDLYALTSQKQRVARYIVDMWQNCWYQKCPRSLPFKKCKMESKLTLDRAVTLAWQSDCVKT